MRGSFTSSIEFFGRFRSDFLTVPNVIVQFPTRVVDNMVWWDVKLDSRQCTEGVGVRFCCHGGVVIVIMRTMEAFNEGSLGHRAVASKTIVERCLPTVRLIYSNYYSTKIHDAMLT